MLNLLLSLAFLALISIYPNALLAHCDSMDGPVVSDARKTLANKKVDSVLKWVGPKDEKIIIDAFQRTLEVRIQIKIAQELADQYFFETIVRIHWASEGESFSGIKPSGDVEPSISAADKTIKLVRAYLQAYVEFIHYVEEIHHLVSKSVSHKHRDI